MGVGRFACVALPFGLSIASLICLLIVMLAGITNKDLYMFDVETKNLSISTDSIQNLINLAKREPVDISTLTTAAQSPGSILPGVNITASDLALADSYKVALWNYCGKTGSNETCTDGKLDWATDATNATELEATATRISGGTVELPSEVSGALRTFAVVLRWTQIVYIIAAVSVACELVLGVFAICSRVGSCFTFLVNGISSTSIIVASIMSTVSSSLVVGAVKTTGNAYNVDASLNTGFLAVTWLAAAFSIGAGLFWMFTICCCASKHNSNKNRGSMAGDKEKLIPTGSYQPLADPTHYNNGHGAYAGGAVPMHNVKPTRGNGAYEPYSHTAI